MNKTCRNCAYGHAIEPTPDNLTPTGVLCRRYPPAPVVIPVRTMQGQGLAVQHVWPSMHDSASCGEHAPAGALQ